MLTPSLKVVVCRKKNIRGDCTGLLPPKSLFLEKHKVDGR